MRVRNGFIPKDDMMSLEQLSIASQSLMGPRNRTFNSCLILNLIKDQRRYSLQATTKIQHLISVWKQYRIQGQTQRASDLLPASQLQVKIKVTPRI